MSDKKVGIITVHRNVNYGANLQAFASCKFINNAGYNAEIIDYYPPEIDKDNYLFSWLKLSYDGGKSKSLQHNLKLVAALAFSAPEKNNRLKNFYNFRNIHCKLSPKYTDFKDIANGAYTDVVCGSDQIWNPDITKGINPLYFGDIPGVKNKISYAASLGRDKYNEFDEQKAAELIKNMDYVSVREEKSIEYIKNISGKDVVGVCDPVFLLPKEEYEKIAKPIKSKKPYLLLYSVVGNNEMLAVAKDFAAKNDLVLVEICQNKKRGAKHIQLTGISPEEFLGAIKDAEYVITNSFHGTAFSLIFQKNFYVFDNKARGSRITNILNKAGLENRIIENNIEKIVKIDYEQVDKNLKDYIASSKQFLLSALSVQKKPLTENCVGCGACRTVCKLDAISLTKNYGGFIKSYINTDKCIDCGMCQKVCPTINVPQKNNPEKVFAFKAEDKIRQNSTSGGAAAALAEKIINDGGVVYGASLDNDFNLKHIRINRVEDITLIQGTKYIQSDMTEVFDNLKNDIENGNSVLFTGTPCQVAAVKNFVLSKKLSTQKLYLCDIICHGVPSPKVFKDYIKWLGDAEKGKITKYYFRNKDFSWRGDSCSAETDTTEIKRNKNVSAFMNLYYGNNITCDACFNCKFTSQDRVGDLTISDFWGIEKDNPDFEDKLGVSMVLVNSQNGMELFSSLNGNSVEANIENAKQPQLKKSVEKPEGYDEFWKTYKENGIDYTVKKYAIPKTTLKTIAYNIIKGK